MVFTMKRLLALVLSLSMLTLALASCGSYKKNKKEKFNMSAVTQISELTGATIAAQTGTFHLDALNAQTTGVNIEEYADFASMLTALNSGVIDGYVAEEPTAFAVIAQNPNLAYVALKNNETGFTTSYEDTGIAIAFKTGSTHVADMNIQLSKIDEATREKLMQQMVTISANSDEIYGEAIALSSSNTDTSRGTLKIAMECAYAPFNWSQTTDANGAVKIQDSDLYANGYDVQIAKFIAAELGLKLEIYAADWDSLIPGVQSGAFDGIIAGMSPTAEREKEVDFTDCYYNSNLVIIYKK